jgi:hypothetical protein
LANLDRQEEPTSSDTPPKRRELSQDNPANGSAFGGAEGGAPARGLPVAREVCPLGPPSRESRPGRNDESNLVSRFVAREKADTRIGIFFLCVPVRKARFTKSIAGANSPGKLYICRNLASEDRVSLIFN